MFEATPQSTYKSLTRIQQTRTNTYLKEKGGKKGRSVEMGLSLIAKNLHIFCYCSNTIMKSELLHFNIKESLLLHREILQTNIMMANKLKELTSFVPCRREPTTVV